MILFNSTASPSIVTYDLDDAPIGDELWEYFTAEIPKYSEAISGTWKISTLPSWCKLYIMSAQGGEVLIDSPEVAMSNSDIICINNSGTFAIRLEVIGEAPSSFSVPISYSVETESVPEEKGLKLGTSVGTFYVNPYPINVASSSSFSYVYYAFTVPVPAGSVVTGGTWTVINVPSDSSIFAPDGTSIDVGYDGIYNLTADDITGINNGGTFQYEALGPITDFHAVYITIQLAGTFPVPSSPPGITIPPWPGVPVYPTYPGWPGDPSLPASGVPFPGWPGGSLWPGYNEWYGTIGGSGWLGWGPVGNRITQGDFNQCHRYRGVGESGKFNSIEKSSSTDVQTNILKSEYLSYLSTNNMRADFIASEYSVRLLQHFRAQITWRIENI
jgi:hypothetical protein